MKHSIANNSGQPLQVLVMSFKIPPRSRSARQPTSPKIVNLDDVKEEPVDGHPTSVLYKLLIGPRNGKRDAMDEAYVVTSFFLMDFAPGGTNFPHHHETAEEIYLVLDGNGEMVAGSGMDGIEGRFPAKAGDAYYFRPNCTVGFYNQNKPGVKAHILAVRSRIPLPEEQTKMSARSSGVLRDIMVQAKAGITNADSENSSRRSFFKMMAAAPLLSQIAARNLYAQAATAIGVDPRQNVYTRLGVKTVINCRGTWTYLSGSLEFPEVRAGAGGSCPVFRQYDRTAAGRRPAAVGIDGRRIRHRYLRFGGRHGRRNGGLHGRHGRQQDLATSGHHRLEA